MSKRKYVDDYLNDMNSTQPLSTEEIFNHIAVLEGITTKELKVRMLIDYIKRNRNHLEICEGLLDVNNGNVISPEDMKALFEKWNKEDEDESESSN